MSVWSLFISSLFLRMFVCRMHFSQSVSEPESFANERGKGVHDLAPKGASTCRWSTQQNDALLARETFCAELRHCSPTVPTMKTIRFTLTTLLGLAVAAGLAAGPKTLPRAEVIFFHPDKFTDAADGPRGSDIGRDSNLEQLKDYLVDRANVYIPEGQKLEVTITDVDLAGEVEPWRGPRFQDTRIVKDIYSPR